MPEQDRRILGGVEPSRMRYVRIPALELVRRRVDRKRVERVPARKPFQEVISGAERKSSDLDRAICPGRPYENPRVMAVADDLAAISRCLGAIGREFDDGQFGSGEERRPRGGRQLRSLRISICHGWRCAVPRIMASTSAVFCSSVWRPSASTFKRRRGCVLEGRTLNHQVGKLTVTPSRWSISAPSAP
jgi:hypothetical protein